MLAESPTRSLHYQQPGMQIHRPEDQSACAIPLCQLNLLCIVGSRVSCLYLSRRGGGAITTHLEVAHQAAAGCSRHDGGDRQAEFGCRKRICLAETKRTGIKKESGRLVCTVYLCYWRCCVAQMVASVGQLSLAPSAAYPPPCLAPNPTPPHV